LLNGVIESHMDFLQRNLSVIIAWLVAVGVLEYRVSISKKLIPKREKT